MRWSSARKGFYYAAAAYLALAVTGTFALMSFDGFEDLAAKDTALGVFLTSLVQPVACPAINTAKARPFSPPRQCLPRTALPAGFFAAGVFSAAAGFIAMTAAHTQKSPILLKRRI